MSPNLLCRVAQCHGIAQVPGGSQRNEPVSRVTKNILWETPSKLVQGFRRAPVVPSDIVDYRCKMHIVSGLVGELFALASVIGKASFFQQQGT